MPGDVFTHSFETTQDPENKDVQKFLKSLEKKSTLDETVDQLKNDPDFLKQIEQALFENVKDIIQNNTSISRDDPQGIDTATMMIAYHNISR
jgi:hypothetical protein